MSRKLRGKSTIPILFFFFFSRDSNEILVDGGKDGDHCKR